MVVYLVKGKQPIVDKYPRGEIYIEYNDPCRTSYYDIGFFVNNLLFMNYRENKAQIKMYLHSKPINIENENIKAIFDDIYNTMIEFSFNGKSIDQSLIDDYLEHLDVLISPIYPLINMQTFVMNILEPVWDHHFNKRLTKKY